METIFDGGEGVGSGGGGGKEWRTARTQILTNLEKQKDILSIMICIHFYQSILSISHIFLLKSDQLIGIPVRRYAGTSIENGTSLNSILKKHALKTHLTCFKVPIGM